MTETYSLPEKKPAMGQSYSLRIAPARTAVASFLARTAGKAVIVTDGFLLARLSAVSAAPRTLFVLFDGDALPLFSMPDGVGAVIAAGGAAALRAARFYAAMQHAACLVLPSEASLFGAVEREGEVKIDGEERTVPLAESEIVCDPSDMAPSFAAAYGEILLSRLAEFERGVLTAWGLPAPREGMGVWRPAPFGAIAVLAVNAALRRGGQVGEGAVLARTSGSLAAYRALSVAYRAFFECGKPRLAVADYRARAARAGVRYADLVIPTAEEISRRASLFERLRGKFLGELDWIARADEAHFAAIRALGGEIPPAAPQEALSTLAERAGGLHAVMRDFGL